MNWTGGSLQRTKKSNGGTIQQQKAYFARARTHVQNVTSSQAVPFRPSYLQADGSDKSTGNLLSHHLAAAKRQTPWRSWQALRATSCDSQEEQQNEQVSRKVLVPFPTVSPSNMAAALVEGNVKGIISRPEQRIAEIDPECQLHLLEANRKRLLKQPDWIGINPSKPVGLPCVPSKDKSRIGKRRKTEIKPGVAAPRRVTTNINSVNRQLQTDELITGPRSDVRRDHLDNLRIRIGTDALTSAYSTQEHERRRSQESSESMLFQQNTALATETEFPEEVVQPANYCPDATARAFQNEHPALYKPLVTHNHHQLEPHQGRYRGSSPSTESYVQALQGGSEAEQTDDHTLSSVHCRSGCIAPGYAVMHRTGGGQQPLRLVFTDTKSFKDDERQMHTKSHRARTCDNTQVSNHVQLLERTAQTRELLKPETDSGHPTSTNVPNTHAIVDVKGWESFLAIPSRDSAHSVAATDSESSMLHQHAQQDHSEPSAAWSQIATQGDQIHGGSSVISALLPLARQSMGQRALTDASDPDPGRLYNSMRKQPQVLGDDEMLWQAFVLGSDDCPSSQILHEWKHLRAPSNELEATRCTSLPAAVVSHNSCSRVFSPSRVGRTHGGMEPAAAVKETSAPQKRSSPVAQNVFGELSDGELSSTFAQRRSSLLNNASRDTSLDVARTIGGTRRVGGSLQHARSSSPTEASPSKCDSRYWSPSMQAKPRSDSSDNALHLVDPNTEE
ncbi:hypothetical protein NX059_001022 [Plenodomus lindquistii]|nr:hypothetical protein NX059_001022 [Plenodomus lindquistii]